ncbi:hypothetical protein AB0M45_28285 [Nocardia sp. NPDC051787]|uniref:hypothetical protein n=1 Tax=Nocardia sp. NPDC051787 TaxID=3155415 RepID=UPI003440914A
MIWSDTADLRSAPGPRDLHVVAVIENQGHRGAREPDEKDRAVLTFTTSLSC